ncbi:MAG: hypothetical protein WCJ62_03165 [Flavobacterium sp.]
MKKITLCTIILLASFLFVSPTTTAAEKAPITAVTNANDVPADVKIMLSRLDEIKAMDKSALNASEKKVLRKEVRVIKSALRSSGNGIYLSVGAIIIIVLLLIILL